MGTLLDEKKGMERKKERKKGKRTRDERQKEGEAI